jgi:hypothetical protein
MYVKFTIQLVTEVIKLFCQKKEVDLNVKDAENIFKSLDEDDDVDKHYFCEAKCITSKRICMKKVDDRGMYCYIHDPDRKCQGNTMSGARCGSVAKVGETHCRRHRDVEEQHYMPKSKDKKDKNPSKPRQPTEENNQRISSATKASVARIRGSTSHDAKKKKKPHTPEFVDTDVDDSSEDDIPKKEAKKEKNMTKKEKSKTKKEKTKAKKGKKELLDEELSEGEVDIFPLSSKVLDIASKKEVPSAERVKWVECPLNDKLEYARNFTVNGKYILKLQRKDAYYHLLTTKNISGDEAPEDLTRKETRILKKIGLRPTTEAEDQNLSLDDSCDEEASDDADSDEESDDEDMHENKAEEKQLVRENPWMRPRCKGFTKQGRKCVKPVDKVDEYCTLHHTQASNRINKENVTWEIFPFANNLEYTYDICIRGRYPLKKRKEDLVVRLVTKEQLLRSDEWYTSTIVLQERETHFMCLT